MAATRRAAQHSTAHNGDTQLRQLSHRRNSLHSDQILAASARLEEHCELGVAVGDVGGLRHKGGHDVAELEQRLVDVLRLDQRHALRARLVHALAAQSTSSSVHLPR